MEQSNSNAISSLTDRELIEKILLHELSFLTRDALEDYYYEYQYEIYRAGTREELIDTALHYKLDI